MQTHPKLLFLHLPKTGGTTVQNTAFRNYPASAIHRWHVGPDAVSTLTALDHSELSLIYGHFSYGVHVYLRDHERWDYAVLLREPVSRIESFYNYVLTTPYHHLHGEVTDKMSLVEFCRDYHEARNLQAQLLAGHDGKPDLTHSGNELLKRAKENLDRVAVVGVLPRFDEFMIMTARHFGWHRMSYVHANRSGSRLNIAPAVRRKILAYNDVDAALYEYADDRSRSQAKGLDMARELNALRRANAARRWLSSIRPLASAAVKALNFK